MRHRWILPIALLGLLVARGTHADGDNPFDDQDTAEAYAGGRIAPLGEVLASPALGPGEAIEVELEKEDGRWIYEVEMLRPDGRIEHLDIDATDPLRRLIERDVD